MFYPSRGICWYWRVRRSGAWESSEFWAQTQGQGQSQHQDPGLVWGTGRQLGSCSLTLSELSRLYAEI